VQREELVVYCACLPTAAFEVHRVHTVFGKDYLERVSSVYLAGENVINKGRSKLPNALITADERKSRESTAAERKFHLA